MKNLTEEIAVKHMEVIIPAVKMMREGGMRLREISVLMNIDIDVLFVWLNREKLDR